MGCAKSEASKEYASGNWGILIGEDNIQVAHFAEILVLAVKPQVLPRVVEQIKDAVSEDTVIVSIAAGVSMDSLGRMFGRSLNLSAVCRILRHLSEWDAPGCVVMSW